MECTFDEYTRSMGRIYTTADGNKYINPNSYIVVHIYLRCVLFRIGCKGTSLITPLRQHNHNIEAYQTDIYRLKILCKTRVKNTQTNLRKCLMMSLGTIPVHVIFHLENANRPYIVQDEYYGRKFPMLSRNFADWFLLQL